MIAELARQWATRNHTSLDLIVSTLVDSIASQSSSIPLYYETVDALSSFGVLAHPHER